MTPPETLAHVAVGSNLDPERSIRRGLAALNRMAPIVAASRFYRTPPVGHDGLVREGEPEFLNGMVAIRTRLAPLALRSVLHQVEADCGRVRVADRYAPRTLDLDLVTYNGRVMDGDLPFRRYLALPLLELAPGFELAPGTPLRDPGRLAMVASGFMAIAAPAPPQAAI